MSDALQVCYDKHWEVSTRPHSVTRHNNPHSHRHTARCSRNRDLPRSWKVRRLIPGSGKRLRLPKRPRRICGPPSLPFIKQRGGGVKRPRKEADHSPPCTGVMNEWSYVSAPPYSIRLHGVQRDNITSSLFKSLRLHIVQI